MAPVSGTDLLQHDRRTADPERRARFMSARWTKESTTILGVDTPMRMYSL
jgi:hypothetical protein